MQVEWQPTQRPPTQRPVQSGGTSVGGGGSRIAIGIALVAAVVLVVVLITRGENKSAAAGDDIADAGAANEEPTPVPEPPREPLPPPPSKELLTAVASLGTALQDQKLISTVKLAPAQQSVVLISSVYCADGSLRQVVEERGAGLRGLGVKLVRCLAEDGTVVFETQL